MTEVRTQDSEDASPLDIGRPVEWLLDPETREVLGVTYVFVQSDERRTVWYTANKRKPKSSVAEFSPPDL